MPNFAYKKRWNNYLNTKFNIPIDYILEGYNKSSVLKHPKIQLKEQKDETV